MISYIHHINSRLDYYYLLIFWIGYLSNYFQNSVKTCWSEKLMSCIYLLKAKPLSFIFNHSLCLDVHVTSLHIIQHKHTISFISAFYRNKSINICFEFCSFFSSQYELIKTFSIYWTSHDYEKNSLNILYSVCLLNQAWTPQNRPFACMFHGKSLWVVIIAVGAHLMCLIESQFSLVIFYLFLYFHSRV